MLSLVLSRSGFCSTDRFHGNGQMRVFLFGAKPAIQNLQPKKRKKRILSFFKVKLPEEAKKIEIFLKFQRRMKKTNILQASFIILKIWNVRLLMEKLKQASPKARMPYNKQLTNRACSGRTGEYWPLRSVSKRLVSQAKKIVHGPELSFSLGSQLAIKSLDGKVWSPKTSVRFSFVSYSPCHDHSFAAQLSAN